LKAPRASRFSLWGRPSSTSRDPSRQVRRGTVMHGGTGQPVSQAKGTPRRRPRSPRPCGRRSDPHPPGSETLLRVPRRRRHALRKQYVLRACTRRHRHVDICAASAHTRFAWGHEKPSSQEMELPVPGSAGRRTWMATDVSNTSSNEASKGSIFLRGASALTNSFSLAGARELARGSYHEEAG